MMFRRAFLHAMGASLGLGGLALGGCSQGRGRGPSNFASAEVTPSTRVRDVIGHPLFSGFGRLLFPTTYHTPTEDMTLADLPDCLPWYSEIHVETAVDIINRLLAQRAAGQTVFYDIYTDAEKDADPSLADTGLFRFAAEGTDIAPAPFAVVSAGGRLRLRRGNSRLFPALSASGPRRPQRVRGHLPSGRAACL